jgi:hypothetical protein
MALLLFFISLLICIIRTVVIGPVETVEFRLKHTKAEYFIACLWRKGRRKKMENCAVMQFSQFPHAPRKGNRGKDDNAFVMIRLNC